MARRGMILRTFYFYCAAALAVTMTSALAQTANTPAANQPALQASAGAGAPIPAETLKTATPVTSTAADASATDQNEQVCKHEAPTVGSRLGGRVVCKTVAEWNAISRDHQNVVRDFQNRSLTLSPTAGNPSKAGGN